MTPNATSLAENIYVPGRVGTYFGDRPHWKEAIKIQRPMISRPVIGRSTGVPLMIFIVPIKSDSGELLGLLSGTLRMDHTVLIPEYIRSDASKDAIFLVVDTDNFLFVEGSSPGRVIEDLPGPGENLLIDAALSGIRFGEVENASGETLIYATNHLQRLGWLFIRAVPKSLATAPAEQAFIRFFLISIGVTLGILLLTYVALRSTTASLTQMTRRIRSMIQKPESSRRLQEQGAPEVRDLAHAFNQLMDERDANNQLKDNFVSNVSHELRTPLTSISGARLITGDIPNVLLKTDGHRLRQILDNFISNAIKFSPENGLVTIQAEKTDHNRLRITVNDEGEGVPDGFKHQLFDRFAQAEVGTTRATSGTGLGLAISRQLAGLLNGDVGFFNRGGAHFWVELPIGDTAHPEGQAS